MFVFPYMPLLSTISCFCFKWYSWTFFFSCLLWKIFVFSLVLKKYASSKEMLYNWILVKDGGTEQKSFSTDAKFQITYDEKCINVFLWNPFFPFNNFGFKSGNIWYLISFWYFRLFWSVTKHCWGLIPSCNCSKTFLTVVERQKRSNFYVSGLLLLRRGFNLKTHGRCIGSQYCNMLGHCKGNIDQFGNLSSSIKSKVSLCSHLCAFWTHSGQRMTDRMGCSLEGGGW